MKTSVDRSLLHPCLRDPLWPAFVEQWPEAHLEIKGLTGRILKGDLGWVIFMAADRDVLVPTHHHGAQWGIVLDGRMELTVGDLTREYQRGEAHFIPAGVDHQALLYAGWRGLYVFQGSAAFTKAREDSSCASS